MGYRFSLSGNTSELESRFFPPINLPENKNWSIGLIGLETYHTIPNIDSLNNKLYYSIDGKEKKSISVPTGSYEISSLNDFLKAHLGTENFALSANNSTLKVKLFTKYRIDFTEENTLAPLLGFESKVLHPKSSAGKTFESDTVVSIIRVNTIRVQCNLVSQSFINGESDHIIHEFFPNVEPGYKIIEVPSPPIYLPINMNRIDRITVRLLDQDSRLINFRGETIFLALHIRSDGS